MKRFVPTLLVLITITIIAPQIFGATLTVTNLGDSGPGTLRDRIASSAAGDTIQFSVLGTITLSNELTIPRSVIIRGPSAHFLRISGNNTTRVFNITGGTVGIISLVVSDGRVVGTNGAVGRNGETVMGGGIRVGPGASLSMSSVVLSNNSVFGGQGGSQNQFGASGNGGNALGGAIANLGTFSLVAANLAGNSAVGGTGGPVTDGASPGVGGQAWGGGLYNESSAQVTICTVSDNKALAGTGLGGSGGASGGGLYNVSSARVIVSTIASNSATGSSFDSGGGIYSAGTLTIQDVTIFGNQADFGGGLSAGVADVNNTILAGNSATSGPDALATITSGDYNLVQNTNGLNITGPTAHYVIGRDPLLDPILHESGYGIGLIRLLIPLRGSPVIDRGNTGNSDQIPVQRPFDLRSVTNAAGGNGSDIGAIEYIPPRPQLEIDRAGSDVVLYWSTNGIDFRLESNTNVATNTWSNVVTIPVVTGDHFYVTNTTIAPHKFYRLAAP